MILTGIAGWLLQATEYYNVVLNIALILMVIQAIATVIVKLTPTPKDDELLHGFTARFLKAMSILPTWGTNPLTKKMYDTLKEMDTKASTPEPPAPQ
jgi:hypothetical protein